MGISYTTTRLLGIASFVAGLTLAADCQPAYKADIESLGCYTDKADARLLLGRTTTWMISGNSPQACANLCGAAGYSLAGVEYGVECYCGNELNPPNAAPGDDSACATKCSGDDAEVCGGYYTANIVKIKNPETDSPLPFGIPNCAREPLCSNPICDASLGYADRVAGLLSNMTLREKANNLVSGSPGVVRLGLPPYQWWSEALHGVAASPAVIFGSQGSDSEFSYATSFPMPILMGAAFDDDLINQVATVVGREGRAFANNGRAAFDFWTPNINGVRDPRWGRALEVPGEDPLHLQRYVYSLITGLQGGLDPEVKTIIATCKHFAVYDVEESRNSDDLDPTAQDLAEYYLPAFKTCARDAKVGAVMCSYNAEFGIPSCANRYLLQNVLREQWNWTAPYHWVTSDCSAITNVGRDHHYVDSNTAAAGVSLNAGTDLACESPPGDTIYELLGDAVAQNITTEASLDQALSRLWSSLIQVGYFNPPSDLGSLGWKDVGTEETKKLAYTAAVKGMTLLKNDGTLPLSKTASKLAVIGPWHAATIQMQGNYFGQAPYLISPLQGFKNGGWTDIVSANGTAMNTDSTDGFEEALSIARESDYIIYCGGIDVSVEAESGDRSSIDWPGNQLDLISQLANLGKKLVVVQFGGGQIDDSTLLNNSKVNALVWAGYPGQEGGNALRDVLDGTYAIAGRLPLTQYPGNYTSQVNKWDPSLRPVKETGNPGRTYMWYPDAILPFGYGLSYTNFTFSVANDALPTSTDISTLLSQATGPVPGLSLFSTLKVKIDNTGAVKSDYVGMLFLSSTNAGPEPRPIRKLVSYARLSQLDAAASDTLSLDINIEALARSDKNGQLYLYPGNYKLALDVDSVVTFNFTLTGEETLLESLPLIPKDPTAISYLGCFQGTPIELLTGPTVDLGDGNAPQSCSDKCASTGYKFAGVQNTKCYCGSSFASIKPDSELTCTSVCPGNKFETCGSDSATNIYALTPTTHPEPPTYTGAP